MKPIYKALVFLCGRESNSDKFNRGTFWTMMSTLLTVTVIGSAYLEIKDANKTNAAEFIHKIKNDFFTETNINLLTYLDEDVLMLDTTNDNAWFNIDTVKYKRLHKYFNISHITLHYPSNQVDELLQNFEDIGLYEKKGLVSLDYIHEGYDAYIKSTWENKQINNYIMWLRSDTLGRSDYTNFEYIYRKLLHKK